MADTHGRHHGEECANGELDGGVALEEVEHRDTLVLDFLGVAVVGQAGELVLDSVFGRVFDQNVDALLRVNVLTTRSSKFRQYQ